MGDPRPRPQPHHAVDDGPHGHPQRADGGRRRPAAIVAVAVLVLLLLTALILALWLASSDGAASTTEETGPAGERTGERTEAGHTATRPEGDVAIFLCDGRTCPEITDEQRSSLEAVLAADDLVVEVAYETSAEAHERFLELFADQPHMTETVDEGTLPPSFRVWLHDPDQADDLAASLADQPGVEEVTVPAHVASSPQQGAPPDVDVETLRDAIDGVAAMTIELCDGRRCPEISDAERSGIEAALTEHPTVSDFRHRTKQENHALLVETFDDREELLEQVTPDLLPETIEVWVVDQQAWFDDPRQFDTLAEDLRSLPGIERLTDRMHDLRALTQP